MQIIRLNKRNHTISLSGKKQTIQLRHVGRKGNEGPIGSQGLQGPQGIQGLQGLKGDIGDIGPTGPKGDKGDKGDQGDQGDPATNLVQSVNDKIGIVILDKSDIGLSNVDNTSDEDKPMSSEVNLAFENVNSSIGSVESDITSLSTQVSGKVSGPTSSTDSVIALFDGITGKLIKSSSVIVDSNNNIMMGKLLFIDAPSGNPEFDFREAGTTRSKTYYDVTNNRLTFQNNENNNIDSIFFTDPTWFDFQITMNGGIRRVPITRTANQGLSSASPSLNLCDATSAAIAITLPSAAIGSGYTYTIKKIDNSGNAVTVQTTGGQLIDGSTTKLLSTQYKYVTVVSDGVSNWYITGSN